MSILVASFAVLLFASCKKDLSPDPSVQRPDLSTGLPAGVFATIEVKNLTGETDAIIESIYSFTGGISGGKFPLEKNENTTAYASYFGKQTLHVAVRGGLGKTVRIIDSGNQLHSKDIEMTGQSILAFEEVLISEGTSIQVIYITTASDY